MYPHVGEAFIPVGRASYLSERLYTKIAKFCQSASFEGSETFIEFEDGRVIIQSTIEGLSLHIFAVDFLTFNGIRTLVEGGLPKVVFRSVESVEWL
ncbi:hypothetical protein [Brucella pseudogrignonensis]|jgi:hypothetical protein|uniref:SMa0974 family conjugal transfer regulator n=1 Tax=Brucella pseudogrignonensis TaxID=419475 RepID=UPI000DE4D313|nr:hypothetical protein [Brucella pseudogrignonensis]KAB2689120.1 hypothetical protein F9K82_10690 [Brucella pseudogrignonensis]